MRRLPWVLALALLLSGCVAEDASPQATPDDGAPVSAAAQALNVTLAPSNDTSPAPGAWLAAVSPDAPVAGFRFTIPSGSAHPYLRGSSFDVVTLAIAPVADPAPKAMALAVFDLSDGRMLGAHLMVPIEGTVWLTAALPSDLAAPADYSPAVLELDDSLDGHDVGVVVAAQGLQGPAALLLSADDRYELGMDPPGREALEARGVGVLPPVATGTAGDGFGLDLYEEIETSLVGTAPGLIGEVVTAGSPQVEQRLPTHVQPHGGLRDDTITTGGQEAGWSISETTFLCGEGAAKYTTSAQMADAQATADGVFVWGDGYGLLVGALATGLPVAMAEGDGPGLASASLAITALETDSLCIALAETFTLPLPVATLLGVPAPAQADAWTGVLADSVLHVAGVPDFG